MNEQQVADEQIDGVALWSMNSGGESFGRHKDGWWSDGVRVSEWDVVGFCAASCRKAGLGFVIGWSAHGSGHYLAQVCFDNGKYPPIHYQKYSTRPATAAVMALSAYLSANPMTPERKEGE